MIDWIGEPPPAPYIIGDLEVCVCVPPENKPRPPLPEERRAIDAYFKNPECFDPTTGLPYRLYGVEIEGVNGALLTYLARPPVDPTAI